MKQEGRASTISRLLEMIGTPRLRGLLLLLFTAGIVCWWWCNLYYAPRDMVEWLEDSNVNVESSPSSSNNQIGILYLYVDSWAEGVSSWMVSISELLIVAKALNATLVEPCIRRGRLVNCQDPAEWNMKLTEVFDVHKMKEYHPHLISHADFLDQTRDVAATANKTVAVVYQVCHSKPKWEKKHCEEQLERQFDVKISSTLERAIEASKIHNTVLQMTSYWREGFSSMEHRGKPLLPDKSNRYVNQIKFKYLHFKQEYFSLIDAMLQDAGIKNDDFSVIQWRGEIMDLDYVTCANHIVTARNIINAAARTNSTPFVLISSLNRNETNIWNGGSKGNGTQEALNILLDDNGFLNLDTLAQKHLKNMKDPLVLAILDLILAMKAKEFTTCSSQCRSICSKCGHQGELVLIKSEQHDCEV